jgi:YHS domain-containing protein
VLVFAATKRGGHPDKLPVDPVCRMAVDPQRAAGMLVHDGARYYFCSLECAQIFAANPEVHAGAGAG